MEKKVIFSQRVIRCSFSRCLFWQRDSRREMLITKRFPRNARHITLFTQCYSRNTSRHFSEDRLCVLANLHLNLQGNVKQLNGTITR